MALFNGFFNDTFFPNTFYQFCALHKTEAAGQYLFTDKQFLYQHHFTNSQNQICVPHKSGGTVLCMYTFNGFFNGATLPNPHKHL